MNLRDFANKKICVALSGGVDSVVLLHYLKENLCAGYSLFAVHCEHGIRGEESLADMRFVIELCKNWGIEVFVFQENCPERALREKESLETSARNFRKECFAKLIADGKVDYIATAHHQKDEAETVLFRIARGSSLSGVVGMREKDGYLIRPLLLWSKERIWAHAKENGLSYRVDLTNLDERYTRNKIRLQVLSALEESVSGATKNLAEFALRAGEDDEVLYEYARTYLEEKNADGEREYLVKFCEKPALFRRACLLALKGLGLEKDYTAEHLSSAFALQNLQRGAKVCFPLGIEGEKCLDGVRIYKKKEQSVWKKTKETPFDEKGFDGGKYQVVFSRTLTEEDLEKESPWRILRIDKEKIPKSAVFRFRKEGDEIKTFGGVGKSLKKFFNEKKIPKEEREYLPLIADGDKVLAVCGVEISAQVKVENDAENALYIIVRKKEN